MIPAVGVLVVDLDGTLVRTNSFRRWTLWHFAGTAACARGPLVYAIRLAGFVGLYGLRAVRLISHRRLKSAFLRLWAVTGGTGQEASAFAERLLRDYLDERVLQIVREAKQNGLPRVLATAAPELYAAHIAQQLEVDVIATREARDGALCDETVGDRKADRVREWLTRFGGPMQITVVTDHADDIPLIMLADRCVLVRADARLRQLAGSRVVQVLQ